MSKKQIRIACVIGTRPEAIKMKPIIDELKREAKYQITIINSAQHRDLLDNLFDVLHIKPDIDLNIMQENQSLGILTGHLFIKMQHIIANQFDMVIAQGDTTTTWVAAQVAFYNNIPFSHVEAGLRSYDLYHPFPEELNRVFVSKLATLHFAPTTVEREILLKENVDPNRIFVTGNTVIDTLYLFKKNNAQLPFTIASNKKLILVTLHRRESFGEPFMSIFQSLIEISKRAPDVEIAYPVHPNPNVKEMAKKILANHANIHLIEPMQYDTFVSLLKRSYLIMSDSGGLQEEAPALGIPLLILREKTERPLVVKLGLAKLVGHNKELIVDTAMKLLTDEKYYQAMQKHISPYGDGRAAQKIVGIINQYFVGSQMEKTI